MSFFTSQAEIDNFLSDIELSRLNEDHLAQLNKAFTRDEVLEAVGQLGSLKAPGIDGKSAIFYQKYWLIVGEDVHLYHF